MNSMDTARCSPEVQRARSLLAELCELGATTMGRQEHLEVLLAFDDLARSARSAWPPPDVAEGIEDIDAALREAGSALRVVLGDLEFHRVEALPIALSVEHVDQALRARS